MTKSFYDRFGREWQTVYPNGSAIQNDYDGLGRVILVRELDAPNGNILRRTAYRCDGAGRLWMIAAVRPEHGPTVTWNVSDESLQITELLYSTLEADPNDPDAQIEIPGAVVTNENGEEISRHAGWVARVKFPDAPCPCDANGSGAIDPDDIFFYLDAWFLQNGLSSPPTPISELTTDMNGDHTVNADDIFAFLDCWFAPPSGCSSGWENQAGDLQFKYLADGRLHSRTSIDGSAFTYAYDALIDFMRSLQPLHPPPQLWSSMHSRALSTSTTRRVA